MNPIRPPLPSVTPTTPSRSTADARAAFFQAVKATAAPTAAQAVLPAPARPDPPARNGPVTATPEAVQPQRYLRPGSIVDIKV